jgi:hypothetical protein
MLAYQSQHPLVLGGQPLEPIPDRHPAPGRRDERRIDRPQLRFSHARLPLAPGRPAAPVDLVAMPEQHPGQAAIQ